MSDAEHDDDLMMIGNFARATGLTASALRFYADAGVLEPDDVDTVSGYRLYGRHQIDSAVMIRRLRDLGMPLARVREVLSGPASDAVRAIEEHLDDLVISTTEARRRHCGSSHCLHFGGAHLASRLHPGGGARPGAHRHCP